MSRGDRLYLEDIAESITAIADFTAGLNIDSFRHDRKTYSATLRELQIIGEAIGKISKETKAKDKTINWRDIKAFRNKITHEYFGVDYEIVWDIVKNELPELMDKIKKLLVVMAKQN
jgi:uncharacterized protein with HEPN domain